MPSYADRMNASKRTFETAVVPALTQKKSQRAAGLAADIAAELLNADRPEVTPPPLVTPNIVAPSSERAHVTPVAVPAPIIETPSVAKSKPRMKHHGVTFREGDLDVITDMLYHCHLRRIRLPGKKGPSIVVQAALDEIVAIFKTDPQRFEAIMRRYTASD